MSGPLLLRPLDVERLGANKAFPFLRISPAVYQTIKMITQMLMPIRISISITSWTKQLVEPRSRIVVRVFAFRDGLLFRVQSYT